MAELIIDLSGRGGLADDFHGDTDMVTTQPELRLAKTSGDIVSGTFNPDFRKGYLSPVTTNTTSLTFDTAPTTILGSVEYDYVSGETYWADRVNSVFSGNTLSDTSLNLVDTLARGGTGSELRKYDEVHDLQIYQIDDERKLFFVGKGLTSTEGGLTTVATSDSVGNYTSLAMSIKSESGTKPSIVTSERDFETTTAQVMTQSITVPSGTNQALFVVAMGETAMDVDCTFNSVSMSAIHTEISSAYAVKVFAVSNPTVTTANVELTWHSTFANKVLYAFVTDNTDQTTLSDEFVVKALPSTTTQIETQIPFIDPDGLNVISILANDVFTINDDSGTIHKESNNNLGKDALFEVSDTGYGLQVGYFDSLPPTNFSAGIGTWLASVATGGFIDDLDTDYAFMRTADNGFAYIFADNHVHKVDGTITGGATGTVTKNVLLFPDYFRITDAIDYRSRLYIAVHQYPVDVATTTLDTYIGECGIYVWNRISAQLTSADYIQLPGVREIKKIYASPDGQLKLLVISNDGIVELRQFGYNDSSGVVFSSRKTFGIGAFPQFPDGLTEAGDRSIWIGNDGNMYSDKSNMITNLFQIKAPGTTSATLATNIETGALLYGSGDETADAGYRSNKQAITFSYADGGTQYLKKIYPFDLKDGSNGAQAQAQGDVYTGVMRIPVTSNVNNIRIYNAPTGGTGTDVIATVKVYFNQSTSATFPDGMTKSITKDYAKRGYVDFKINQSYISSLQIEVEWSTSIDLGVDTYLPSTAVVTFEQTTTQSPDNG